jgi:hypothetical protein
VTRALAVAMLALAACARIAAPRAPAAPGPRVVTVRLEAGWPTGHADLIRGALAGGWLRGHVVRVVGPGTPADVEIRHAEFADCRPAADYAARVIRWDPTCTPGLEVVAHVLRHEVMHHLGCRHLCRRAGEPGCVGPPVGLAVMNAHFDRPDTRVPNGKACCAPSSVAVEPTPADLAELARAEGRRP